MRRLRYQLFLVNVATFLIFLSSILIHNWVLAPEKSPPGRAQRALSWVLDAERPAAEIEARITRMRAELGGLTSVYDRDGALLATSAHPPVPLDPGFASNRFATHDAAGAETGWIVFGPLPRRALSEIGIPLLASVGITGVLGLGLALLVTRRLVGPLTRLTEATRAVGRGEFSGRVALEREDELGMLGRAFDEMTRRLAHLQRSQRELLASVSHELRTPLARMRFALTMMREGEAVDEMVPELGADLDELERMVTKVLAATRLDLEVSDGAPLSLDARERIEGRALVDRIVARFRLAHADRELLVAAADELGALEADINALLRACDNLLENAYRYGPPDQPLRLDVCVVDGELRLSFSDAGPGIAEELHALIFTPFFRADPSRSRETGGLGLGLTLVARIVAAHGGTVCVTSSPGAGATFSIQLPRIA